MTASVFRAALADGFLQCFLDMKLGEKVCNPFLRKKKMVDEVDAVGFRKWMS